MLPFCWIESFRDLTNNVSIAIGITCTLPLLRRTQCTSQHKIDRGGSPSDFAGTQMPLLLKFIPVQHHSHCPSSKSLTRFILSSFPSSCLASEVAGPRCLGILDPECRSSSRVKPSGPSGQPLLTLSPHCTPIIPIFPC